MNTSLLALLQVTAILLTGITGNNKISTAAQQQIVATASQVVQLSTQAAAVIPFSVMPNDSLYPDFHDLANAPYLGANGSYVPLGNSVHLAENDISFGDLNGDGQDDAAVVVEKVPTDGAAASYAIAAMLNQNGILFNIADYPLGSTLPTINAHDIVSGKLVMNMQTAGAPAVTSTYELWGNQWEKIN